MIKNLPIDPKILDKIKDKMQVYANYKMDELYATADFELSEAMEREISLMIREAYYNGYVGGLLDNGRVSDLQETLRDTKSRRASQMPARKREGRERDSWSR